MAKIKVAKNGANWEELKKICGNAISIMDTKGLYSYKLCTASGEVLDVYAGDILANYGFGWLIEGGCSHGNYK